MPDPCEQKETIDNIWDSIGELEKTTAKIETSVIAMVDEFRLLSKDLRESLLDGRETRTKINQNAQDIDRLFGMVREIHMTEVNDRASAVKLVTDLKLDLQKDRDACKEKEIKPLKEWQDEMKGSLKAFRIVPIICTIVTVMLAIFEFVK